VGLFFVSIGMLVDLGFVLENAGVVVLILVLIVAVKGLLTVGLTSAFRVPVRASILSSVALAQCAEFSFLLASIGVDLGALSRDQFSALVAAAVLSVIAAPALLAGATRVGNRLEQAANRELRLTNAVGGERLRDHVVLCGHGRVGSVVLEALLTQDVRVAVIDQDPTTVLALRDRGLLTFMGRADNEVLLRRAQLETASTLVIAVPDRATVRRLVRFAREWNPGIAIVARTHETAERDYLEANGVNDAVVGELELALQMVRYVLRSTRLDPTEIEAELERVRYAVD
jgi:monovalent cation:H+ antiporter-2, CPA2 family